MKVIGGKWKPLILWQLRNGPSRFSAIKNGVEGITQKVLTQQLRELENDDLIERVPYLEMPLRVEYNLTPQGETLFPILRAMAKWGYDQNPVEFDQPLSDLKTSPAFVTSNTLH